MILDATTKSLEFVLGGAVSANEAEFTAYYADKSSTVFTPGTNDGTSNGATHVTWVAAPSASQQRLISELSLYNSDTAQIVVTVKLNNNGTRRTMFTVTLETEEQLLYTSESGWLVYDSNGTTKENSGAPFDAQYVLLGTNTTLTQERVLTGTANQITITDNGAGNTVVLSAPQDLTVGGIALTNITQITNRSHTNLSDIGTNTHAQIDTHIGGTGTAVHGLGTMSTQNADGVVITGGTLSGITGITLSNDALHILDTDASHDLVIVPGSNLTADRILSLVTGDAARTITLSGNPTLADWFDQSLKKATSPQFVGITLTGGDIIASTATTWNLLNTVATTINFGGAASTAINIGNSSGQVTVSTSKLKVNTAGNNVVADFESTDQFAQIYLSDNTTSDDELIRREGDTTTIYSAGLGLLALSSSGVSLYQATVLGSTLGNNQKVWEKRFDVGSNDLYDRIWAYRDANGSSWTTTRIHEGVGVDASFGTPRTDTKVWRERDPNNNIFEWGTGSTSYMIINNGNVGIGTTNPGQKLEIYNSSANSVFRVSTDTVAVAGFDFVMERTTNDVYLIQRENADMYFRTNNSASSQMVLKASGNVGIGTTGPGAKLHINNSTGEAALLLQSEIDDARLKLVSSNGVGDEPTIVFYRGLHQDADRKWAMYVDDVTDDIRFYDYVNGKDTVTFEQNGNVGIGLTPTANMNGLSIEAGLLTLKETTTPTDDANYGKIYTKSDNKLYFQDGAGTEHEIAYV